jgi:hypothetical protein
MKPSEIELEKRYKLVVRGKLPQYKIVNAQNALKRYGVTLPADFDWTWKALRGKLPKRIERHIANETEIDITPDLSRCIMEIGNSVSDCIPPDEVVEFRFTDQLNWKNGDYGDPNSCFWGGSVASRGVLRDNGARAVQFLRGDKGYARCWLIDHEDWPLIFNGYGLKTEQIALVLREFFEETDVWQCGLSLGEVFTNFDGAWYIAPKNPKKTQIQLAWKKKIECKHCGKVLEEGESVQNLGFNEQTLRNYGVCRPCRKLIVVCPTCSNTCKQTELVSEQLTLVDNLALFCPAPKCKSVLFLKCAECDEVLTEQEIVWKKHGDKERATCKKHG